MQAYAHTYTVTRQEQTCLCMHTHTLTHTDKSLHPCYFACYTLITTDRTKSVYSTNPARRTVMHTDTHTVQRWDWEQIEDRISGFCRARATQGQELRQDAAVCRVILCVCVVSYFLQLVGSGQNSHWNVFLLGKTKNPLLNDTKEPSKWKPGDKQLVHLCHVSFLLWLHLSVLCHWLCVCYESVCRTKAKPAQGHLCVSGKPSMLKAKTTVTLGANWLNTIQHLRLFPTEQKMSFCVLVCLCIVQTALIQHIHSGTDWRCNPVFSGEAIPPRHQQSSKQLCASISVGIKTSLICSGRLSLSSAFPCSGHGLLVSLCNSADECQTATPTLFTINGLLLPPF